MPHAAYAKGAHSFAANSVAVLSDDVSFFLGSNYSHTSCRLIIILWWPCWGRYDTISTVVGEHPVCLNCVIVAKRLFLQYSFNDGSIMFEKIQNETLRAKDRLHRKVIMSCLELIPTLHWIATHRKRTDNEVNLLLWSISTIRLQVGMH